jgi:hypothetical protein
VTESLAREIETERGRRTAGRIERRKDLRVVGRIHHDEHVPEVLGGRADHTGAADVDLLDQIVEGHVGPGCRLYERIQVHHDQIDQADTMCLRGLQVLGVRTPREDATVDERVQRLDAAVHHLGKLRDVGHVGDGEACLGQCLRGAAGRDQLESAGLEAGGQVDQSGFVGNAQQGSWHGGKYDERIR